MSDLGFYFLAALAIGAAMITKSSTAQPRGLRNNNPLNIRQSNNRWVGAATTQNDPEFVKFTEPKYGVRAGYKTLMTYRNKYGLNTIRGIISRWAPPSENATNIYIDFVSKKTGLNPDKVLPLNEYPVVMAAMIHMELGQQPFAINDLATWSQIP